MARHRPRRHRLRRRGNAASRRGPPGTRTRRGRVDEPGGRTAGGELRAPGSLLSRGALRLVRRRDRRPRGCAPLDRALRRAARRFGRDGRAAARCGRSGRGRAHGRRCLCGLSLQRRGRVRLGLQAAAFGARAAARIPLRRARALREHRHAACGPSGLLCHDHAARDRAAREGGRLFGAVLCQCRHRQHRSGAHAARHHPPSGPAEQPVRLPAACAPARARSPGPGESGDGPGHRSQVRTAFRPIRARHSRDGFLRPRRRRRRTRRAGGCGRSRRGGTDPRRRRQGHRRPVGDRDTPRGKRVQHRAQQQRRRRRVASAL